MKKYIAVLLTLTLMLGLGAVTVQAAGNYPSTDADFGVTIDILEDGSVNIGANADAINSAVSSVAVWLPDLTLTGYILLFMTAIRILMPIQI